MAIKRVSLSQQVFESIVNYVKENGLRVGDKLPTESEFSSTFNVSRTSIREAMKALSMSGAVESIPGKGTYMRAPMLNYILDDSDNLTFQAKVSISQVMEVRTSVEVLAGHLAIKRATDNDIKKVEEAMENLRQNVLSQKPWALEGAQFHIRIAECSGNPLVIQLINSYSETIGRYRDAMVDSNTERDMEFHIKQHQDILDALKARDDKQIEKAIRAHMQSTEDNLKRLVTENSAIQFIGK